MVILDFKKIKIFENILWMYNCTKEKRKEVTKNKETSRRKSKIELN